MSNATMPVKDKRNVTNQRVEQVQQPLPTWWIIFVRELAELWIGGKALILLFIYSILLSIMAYVLASNSELSLIPPKEMVFLTLQTALSVGGFIAVIVGADSISGERERATLEALLLTPTSRLQIVVGKFLAAISPWPAAMLITLPYLSALAQGDEVFGQAVYWGFLLGSLISLSYTGVGMLASIWANSNRTSLGVSLVIYIICALPVQFPGNAQTGTMGRFLKALNPMEAADQVLEKILVNNRTPGELSTYLRSPIILPVLILGLLFLYAAPRLRLDGGIPFTFRPKWGGANGSRIASLFLVIGLISCLAAPTALATGVEKPTAQDAVPQLPLSITIDTKAKVVNNGDPIFFKSLVRNNGAAASPALILAMNIINLNSEGDVVDPEDWSPQRTQYVDALAPGKSAEHTWRLNTILEGNYMVYMVLIPAPDSAESTSWPLTSAGMHVTVQRFVRANPGGVTPYVLGIPTGLLLTILLIYRYRRQSIDTGDTA